MGRAIRIVADDVVAAAELDDTRTARAIWAALPLEARPDVGRRDLLRHRNPGRGGGSIFFGPTPTSQGDEIRPASPVAVVGRVVGDATVFKKVPAGTTVRLERHDKGAR